MSVGIRQQSFPSCHLEAVTVLVSVGTLRDVEAWHPRRASYVFTLPPSAVRHPNRGSVDQTSHLYSARQGYTALFAVAREALLGARARGPGGRPWRPGLPA